MTRRKAEADKVKTGRPTLYNDDLTTIICVRMSSGMSLNKICKAEDMPHISSVFEWLIRHPEFADKYARAQTARAETLMDELVDISDEPADHSFRTPGDPGGVQHRKLQIDTRKWAISKMFPKKYGEKVETTHAGSVEINQITRKIVDPDKKIEYIKN